MTRSAMTLATLGLAATLAGGCEIEAESIGVEGSFDRTLRVSGPVDLDVLSRSGRIQVQVGSDDTVHIVGRIRAYGSSMWMSRYTAAEQVKALEASPPIDQTANTITVGDIQDDALASNVSISYEVTVPADTRLRTSSRSGDQIIDAVRGPVSASSRSGNIHIGRAAADVDVETRSGDVELLGHSSGVRVNSRSGHVSLDGQPSRTWIVDTRSGDVDVRLPADAGLELDLQTRSGSVDSDRPLQMRDMRSRKHIQGTVGRGGARLEVSTTSGSVRIR